MKTVFVFFIALFLISSSFVANAKALRNHSVGCPDGTRAVSVCISRPTAGLPIPEDPTSWRYMPLQQTVMHFARAPGLFIRPQKKAANNSVNDAIPRG